MAALLLWMYITLRRTNKAVCPTLKTRSGAKWDRIFSIHGRSAQIVQDSIGVVPNLSSGKTWTENPRAFEVRLGTWQINDLIAPDQNKREIFARSIEMEGYYLKIDSAQIGLATVIAGRQISLNNAYVKDSQRYWFPLVKAFEDGYWSTHTQTGRPLWSHEEVSSSVYCISLFTKTIKSNLTNIRTNYSPCARAGSRFKSA